MTCKLSESCQVWVVTNLSESSDLGVEGEYCCQPHTVMSDEGSPPEQLAGKGVKPKTDDRRLMSSWGRRTFPHSAPSPGLFSGGAYGTADRAYPS